MIRTIFVNRKNTVDTYQVNIDKGRIAHTKKTIDKYNGKGKKLEVTTSIDFFVGNSDFFGKNVEIISKKYEGKGDHFDYCCAEIDSVDIYKFKYYAYTPHKLSQLCTNLLKSTNSLNLSYCIRDILDYKCKSVVEQKFLEKILNSIKFKKINDVNFLIKVRNELKKLTSQNNNVQLDVNFDKVVEQKIDSMQIFNEAFHSQELKGQPLKYTLREKKNIKKKILLALPTEEILKLQ